MTSVSGLALELGTHLIILFVSSNIIVFTYTLRSGAAQNTLKNQLKMIKRRLSNGAVTYMQLKHTTNHWS